MHPIVDRNAYPGFHVFLTVPLTTTLAVFSQQNVGRQKIGREISLLYT